MSTVSVVHHRVADYAAWKKVYDSVRPVQRQGGVREHRVWRSAEEPRMVVVVHVFDTAVAARAFFALPDLRQAMAEAGVDLSSFRIEFLEEEDGGAV